MSGLTCLLCGHDVLGDGDSVLRAAGPVHHAPPALHGEVDVSMSCHGPLVDAQDWREKAGLQQELRQGSVTQQELSDRRETERRATDTLLGGAAGGWKEEVRSWPGSPMLHTSSQLRTCWSSPVALVTDRKRSAPVAKQRLIYGQKQIIQLVLERSAEH